jgi:hypothetical protein
MNTLWTQDYQSKKIAWILKEYSAKKYGRKREFVDAEIQARLWMTPNEEELPESPEGMPPETWATPESVAQMTAWDASIPMTSAQITV